MTIKQSPRSIALVLLLSALCFSHLIKFLGVFVYLQIPSAIIFLAFCCLSLISLMPVFHKIRLPINSHIIVNAVPWIFMTLIPSSVAVIKGYDLLYVGVSVFNLGITGIIVSLLVPLILSYKGHSLGWVEETNSFFIFFATFILSVGFVEFGIYLYDTEKFLAFSSYLIDAEYLSLLPVWKVMDLHVPRIFGYFQNPLSFGFASLALAAIFWAKRKWLPFWLLLIAGALSVTKTLYLISALVLFLLIFNKKISFVKLLAYHAAAVVGVMVIISIAQDAVIHSDLNREAYQSLLTRVDTWSILFGRFLSDPSVLIFGAAISQVSQGNPIGVNDVNFAIDNLYLLLFLYTGGIGLMVFIGMYYWNLYFLVKRTHSTTSSLQRIRVTKAVMALWFVLPIWGVVNALIGNLQVFYFTYSLVLLVLYERRDCNDNWGGRCQ